MKVDAIKATKIAMPLAKSLLVIIAQKVKDATNTILL